MADVKTHLRELSVATTVGLLNANIEFSKADLYDSKRFYTYAQKVIHSNISSATNILDYDTFTGELKLIIDNGYKLGKKIFESPYFKFSKNDKILWLGNDTQKGNPIDLQIGNYSFSLKEESFILKNMGLYQLLNNLTGSNYSRGLHVFSTFAPVEYDTWFNYTWRYLVNYLARNISWELRKGNNVSRIFLSGATTITLYYNGICSNVPININTNADYMKHTVSTTREKVFSKWIADVIANDPEYTRLKKVCSEVAGKRISEKINSEFQPNYVYDFFQIYPKDYYYAKTTAFETTILRVPSRSNFNSIIEFQGCRYDVPSSQLNIITTFKNKKTNKVLEFRNECRFSHGQFNGTPEAKLYVVRNTPLTELYEPIE